eukprot:394325-Pyramimonas_sp.AAC.1
MSSYYATSHSPKCGSRAWSSKRTCGIRKKIGRELNSSVAKRLIKGLTYGARKRNGGGLNSSVVKRLIKGLTDRFCPPRFSGARKKIGTELNSSVVKRLIKGLTDRFRPIFGRPGKNFGGRIQILQW